MSNLSKNNIQASNIQTSTSPHIQQAISPNPKSNVEHHDSSIIPSFTNITCAGCCCFCQHHLRRCPCRRSYQHRCCVCHHSHTNYLSIRPHTYQSLAHQIAAAFAFSPSVGLQCLARVCLSTHQKVEERGQQFEQLIESQPRKPLHRKVCIVSMQQLLPLHQQLPTAAKRSFHSSHAVKF